MRSITNRPSSVLNSRALLEEARRRESARLLATETKTTGPLRRLWGRFLGRVWQGVMPTEARHPAIRFDRRLRSKSAAQLIKLHRRQLEDVQIAKAQVARRLPAILRGTTADIRGTVTALEERRNLIEAELRRRGMLDGLLG